MCCRTCTAKRRLPALTAFVASMPVTSAVAIAHDGPHHGQGWLDHVLTIAVDMGALVVLALPLAAILILSPVPRGIRWTIALTSLAVTLWGGIHVAHHLAERPEATDGAAWQTMVAATGLGIAGIIGAASPLARRRPGR